MAPASFSTAAKTSSRCLGGDAGRGRGDGGIQGAAQDQAGLVHGAHLGVGLVFDTGLAESHGVSFRWLQAPPGLREEPPR